MGLRFLRIGGWMILKFLGFFLEKVSLRFFGMEDMVVCGFEVFRNWEYGV